MIVLIKGWKGDKMDAARNLKTYTIKNITMNNKSDIKIYF